MHAWLPWIAVVITSSSAWAQPEAPPEKADAPSDAAAEVAPDTKPTPPASETPADAPTDAAAEVAPDTEPAPPAPETPAIESEESEGAPYNLQLGVGLGQQYAGLGASVCGYARISGMWSLGAFAAGGLADVESCCSDWGYAAGLLAAWGVEDRVALAVSYGAVWNQANHIDYGITAAAGYELLSRHGFWMRWLVGVAVSLDTERDAIPSINLGLGWSL